MRIPSEAKQSAVDATETDLSVSEVPFGESKEKEKAVALSSAFAELVVDIKENK